MGQKVNPHGLRVGVIKDWDSRWFVKEPEFGKTLVSDYKLRNFLKKSLFEAGIPKIEIERDQNRIRVIIHCAKPGKVIGRGGSEIDKLRENIEKIAGKPAAVNVVEVKSPDLNAQLVAESVGAQLIRRVSYRRAMKQAILRTMKLGAKGIKIQVSGILGATDIARTEHYHEGTIPLQTIRADIDYGYYPALTKMGLVGVKVWIYKGEVLNTVKRESRTNTERPQNQPRDGAQRRDNRDRPPRGEYPRGGERPFNNNRDNNRGGQSGFRPRGDRPQGGYNNNRQGGGFNNNRSGGYNNNNDQPRQNYGNRREGAPIRSNTTTNANTNQANTSAPSSGEQGGNNDVNA